MHPNSLKLANTPSFVDWLQMQAQQSHEPSNLGDEHGDSPTSSTTSLTRDARSLLTLAQITHTARVQAQEIESIRGIAGGFLRTPFVSNAIRAQNHDLQLTATRTAYLSGAGHGDRTGQI